MIPRIYSVGIWSGMALAVLFMLGFVILARFVPAHSPAASAQDIAAIYQAGATQIRLGMVVTLFASAFYLPWTVMLSAFIRRMEGESTFLSQCQLVGGTVGSLFLFLPVLCWAICAFRPDRNPDITLMLNDAGWLLLITPAPPFLVQFFSLGYAILTDRSGLQLMPRWLGYTCFWIGILFTPAVLSFFLKTGPFAWNGLFSFWIPFVLFFSWFLLVFFSARDGLRRAADSASGITPAKASSTVV